MAELVTIFETHDQTEAILYRSMLEEAGINVLETNLRDPGLLQAPGPSYGNRVQLQVLPADVAKARELVQAFRQEALAGEYALPADEDEPVPPDVDEAFLARLRWVILVLFFALVIALLLFTRLGGFMRSLLGAP